MKKLTTYLLSTGAIVAAAIGMSAVASADVVISPGVEVTTKVNGENQTTTKTNFDTLDAAVEALAKTTGDITITLDTNYTLSKKLPSKAEKITLTAASGVTVDASKVGMTAKGDLILNNVSVKGDGKKTKVDVKGNLSLTGTSAFDSLGSLKGARTSTLDFEAAQVFNFDVSGFSKINVEATDKLSLVGIKKIQTGELAIATGGVVNVFNTPVQVDALTGAGTIYYISTTTSDSKVYAPAAITVKKEFEAANTVALGYKTFNASSAAKVSALTVANATAIDGATETTFADPTKVLVLSKVSDNSTNSFALTTTAKAIPDGSTDPTYTLSREKKGKEVYVRPIVYSTTIGTTAKKYALWTSLVEDIQTASGAGDSVNYTVKVLTDTDVAGAMKMPKKGTYGTLTLMSGKTTEGADVPEEVDPAQTISYYTNVNDATAAGTTALLELDDANYIKIGDDYFVVNEEATGDNEYKFNSANKSTSAPDGWSNKSASTIATTDITDSATTDSITLSEQTNASVWEVGTKTYAVWDNAGGTATFWAEVTSEPVVKLVKGAQWAPTAPLAVVKYTGAISATGNLVLQDLELYSYKYDKKKDAYNGVATSISGGKYDVTLNNISLHAATTGTNATTATTLKAVTAKNLTLINQGSANPLKADKISGTKLSVTGSAYITAQSLAFKGDSKNNVSGISGNQNSIVLEIVDKTGKQITDPKKVKVTLDGYTNQIEAINTNYKATYNGKVVSISGKMEADKAVSDLVYTLQNSSSSSNPVIYFADMKSIATYLANEVKAGRLTGSENWTLSVPSKPAKLELPKAGNYASITLTSNATSDGSTPKYSFASPLDLGTVASLKLTGNLTLSENVKIKVTKQSGDGTLVDTFANKTYVNAVEDLVTYVTSSTIDTAADSTRATKVTAVETAAKVTTLDVTSTAVLGTGSVAETPAKAKAAYDNIVKAIKFVTDNKAVLDKITSAAAKDGDADDTTASPIVIKGAKDAYDAYVALKGNAGTDTSVTQYLAKEVAREGSTPNFTYQWKAAAEG